MPTTYNVYSNDGAGSPVDYATPIATTSSLAYVGDPLAAPSDTTFAVRATDGTSEEQNVDCRVRIVIDADGNEVSARPNAPSMASAAATSAGGARVYWFFVPHANTPTPIGFKVWLTSGPTVDYAASPAANVPHVGRQNRYSASLSGLSDGVSYSVGVRAYNATADDPNTSRCSVVGIASAPSAVASLTGSATFIP